MAWGLLLILLRVFPFIQVLLFAEGFAVLTDDVESCLQVQASKVESSRITARTEKKNSWVVVDSDDHQSDRVVCEKSQHLNGTSGEEKYEISFLHNSSVDLNSTSRPIQPTEGGGVRQYAVFQNNDGKTPVVYHGAQAKISLWQPSVHPQDISRAQIRICAKKDCLHLGWQVYPQRYQDNLPRLFVLMTNDSYNRVNCYDSDCHDTFRESIRGLHLGKPIRTVSTLTSVQVEKRFGLHMMRNGEWHVFVNRNHVGFWPSRVLPSLSHGAVTVQWGGEVVAGVQPGTGTQMGSGRPPVEGYGKAAYFTELQYVRGDVKDALPTTPAFLSIARNHKNCYDIHATVLCGQKFVFYGGPGKKLNCP